MKKEAPHSPASEAPLQIYDLNLLLENRNIETHTD